MYLSKDVIQQVSQTQITFERFTQVNENAMRKKMKKNV